ncbi:MAG: hypothetical protein AAB646_02885 [Patescibacteria group bacterium]|mgnify:CR=1 FL=1
MRTVFHVFTGNIAITKHAWERFRERYLMAVGLPKTHVLSDEEYMELITRSFERADFDEKSSKRKLVGLLNNRQKPVDYYIDQVLNLRYVVSKGEDPVLVTVEIPRVR